MFYPATAQEVLFIDRARPVLRGNASFILHIAKQQHQTSEIATLDRITVLSFADYGLHTARSSTASGSDSNAFLGEGDGAGTIKSK